MTRPLRCPHGYVARLDTDIMPGWIVPLAPSSCQICRTGSRVGIPYKQQQQQQQPQPNEESESCE